MPALLWVCTLLPEKGTIASAAAFTRRAAGWAASTLVRNRHHQRHGKGGPLSPSSCSPSPRHHPQRSEHVGVAGGGGGPLPHQGALAWRCAPRGCPQVPTAPPSGATTRPKKGGSRRQGMPTCATYAPMAPLPEHARLHPC